MHLNSQRRELASSIWTVAFLPFTTLTVAILPIKIVGKFASLRPFRNVLLPSQSLASLSRSAASGVNLNQSSGVTQS